MESMLRVLSYLVFATSGAVAGGVCFSFLVFGCAVTVGTPQDLSFDAAIAFFWTFTLFGAVLGAAVAILLARQADPLATKQPTRTRPPEAPALDESIKPTPDGRIEHE